ERRKCVREDEARRVGGIEERVALPRDRGSPVISPGYREIEVLPEVHGGLTKSTHQPALLRGRLAEPLVRVVDGHEVRIEEILAHCRVSRRLFVSNRVANESGDPEVVVDLVAVDVEN